MGMEVKCDFMGNPAKIESSLHMAMKMLWAITRKKRSECHKLKIMRILTMQKLKEKILLKLLIKRRS
jgi:hypothetical protein